MKYDDNYLCESSPISNGRFQHIEVTFSHHYITLLKMKFQTSLNKQPIAQSYAIKNLEVYILYDCHASCRGCAIIHFDRCDLCPAFAELNSSTRCQCTDNFFMDVSDHAHCVECDLTCKTCDGPTDLNCISCYTDNILSNGKCNSPISYLFLIYFHL